MKANEDEMGGSMLKKLGFPVSLIIFCLMAGGLPAAATAPLSATPPAAVDLSATPITLQQALATALAQNPEVQAAAAAVRDARTELFKAQFSRLDLSAGLNPQIYQEKEGDPQYWRANGSLTAGLSLPGGGTLSLITDWAPTNQPTASPMEKYFPGLEPEKPAEGLSTPATKRLEFEQPLLRPLDTIPFHADLKSARLRVERRQLQELQVKQKVALQVGEAFFGLVRAQNVLDISRRGLARSEEALRIARRRAAEGNSSSLSLKEAEIGAERSKLAASKAEHGLDLAREALRLAIGVPEARPVSLTAVPLPGNDKIFSGQEDFKLDGLLETASRQSIDARLAQLDVEDARMALDKAIAAVRPQARLVAGYDEDKSWSVGLNLNWQILGSSEAGNLGNMRIEAEAGFRQAGLAADQAKDRALQQTRQDYYGWLEARDQLAVATAEKSRAEEAEKVSEARLKAGIITGSEHQSAADDLRKAEADLESAQFDYLTVLARLRAGVGQIPLSF
ncbi:MAG: TolC family protein [Firmicutes bacterium]|nr:TolC family protein [Bacillota bacterium]